MMNNGTTYGQLHQKLKEIGYKQCVVQVDGKDGIAFEHEKVRGA